MRSKTFVQYEEDFLKVTTIIRENEKVYNQIKYKPDNHNGKIHFRLY